MNKKVIFQLIIILSLVISSVFIFQSQKTSADDVTTTLTVGNSAPTLDTDVVENPQSEGTVPTNVDENVTFEVTASDANGEDYYLIVCTTNAATATNGGAPTCDVGTYCVSSATTSGVQATCDYTAQDADPEINNWIAFICDGNASSASCSIGTAGADGSAGSPFIVNHRPVFATISNTANGNPGDTITYSTNIATLDNDTAAIPGQSIPDDTVKLIVCKTAGLNGGNTDCDGGASDKWCESSFVANNPSCGYSIVIPTADASYDGYVYLVDNHGLPSDDANQGTNNSFAVNNVAPVVSSVVLNSGSDISLTENTTTNIGVSATVTDNNGCSEITQMESTIYRSGIGVAGCTPYESDDETNRCETAICTVVLSGNTCDGATDASVAYDCSGALQFHADPTDTATIYVAENWIATAQAVDDDLAPSAYEDSVGVELLSLVAIDVNTTIAYGSVGAGQTVDPLSVTNTATSTGNVGLDIDISGTNMTSGGDSIDVGEQKYALAAATAYASGVALTGIAVEAELNCAKTVVTGSPTQCLTYWGINVPNGTPSGSYTGTNTIIGVKGETANW